MRKGRAWCVAMAIAAAAMLGRADAQTTPAQNWPAKPIRIIVPYPPGGLSDVFARLIGDKLARVLRQSVVIDNRPGGNTIIGTQATAQAAPDGYTLLLTNGALSINQSLVANLPYDLDRDLAPAATPRPVIDKLNAAVNEVLRDPDTIARGRTLGLRIGGGPPEQLNEIMAKVTQIYAKVIKSANIKPD